MKNYLLSLLVVMFAFMVACGGNSGDADNADSTGVATGENKIAEYDLSANGIPVLVTGPAGAEVQKGLGNAEIDGEKTINYVVDKEAFKLDVTFTDGTGYDKAELFASSLEIAKEEEGFEMISQDDNGFIYKKKADDGDDYGFYYGMMKDGKPVEFSAGLNLNSYTLDQIKVLYEAAKAAK